MKTRVAATVALALAIVFGTAGCNLLAPQATTVLYDPSDGVGGTVGQIDVRNALLIGDDAGRVGNLVVTLVNNGLTSRTVTIGSSGQSAKTTVEPGEIKQLGTQSGASGKETVLLELETIPGGLQPVYFQYGDETGVQLKVPVLDGGLEEYKDLVPPSPAS